MPPLVRLFVRTSFLYFVGAFLLGAFMALDSWLGLARWLRAVYLSQLHLLVVGWVTQLAIGVAYWMFPRFRREVKPQPRGSERLTWAVYLLLNGGLLLRFAFEPLYLMGPKPWLAATVALSGVLQALAALAFAALIWGRVRPMEP